MFRRTVRCDVAEEGGVVGPPDRAYVKRVESSLCAGRLMADGVSTGVRFGFAPILAAGGVGAVVAVTLALWVHYGSAVFFDMIAAGFRACF